MKQQTIDNARGYSWPSTLHLTTEHFGQEDFVMTEAEMLKAIHELNAADPNGKPLTLDHCERLEFVRARADNTARSEERRVGKECRSRWSPYH